VEFLIICHLPVTASVREIGGEGGSKNNSAPNKSSASRFEVTKYIVDYLWTTGNEAQGGMG
jgi:hypothetical protein